MRRFLDGIYWTSGAAAAVCLLAILCVIVLQMLARWFSVPFPGSTAYAGYLMASASFLGLAYALNSGSHIRVSLLINSLGAKARPVEIWCMLIGAVASTYLAWFSVKAIYWAVKFHEVSQGQDATPIWIVQMPVAFGAILLAICFWDNLITLLITGKDNINKQELEGPEV